MARHEIIIHENTGATKEVAPYLGTYIHKDTVALRALAAEAAKKSGLTPIQVEAIITGCFELIEELEREELTRIHTDLGTICGRITGSFPTADAPFDPDRNALELVLRPEDTVRLALTDTVPSIVTSDTVTKLRVDNVADLETPRPYNVIHGQGVFRVAGFNMVLDDEGAGVHIENALGTTFPVAVDEVISKQLFKGHSEDLLEAGDYKLVVKSRAGDAEGPLQTAFRRVKYLYVAPPTVITTVAPASGDPGTTKSGVCMNIAGGELLMGDGDICKVRGVKNGESVEFTYTKADMTVNSNTMVTTALPKALAAHCFDANSKCYWSVKGSAEFETTYLDS